MVRTQQHREGESIKRDWRVAKLWLRRELGEAQPEG
jgi:hypothetical protein